MGVDSIRRSFGRAQTAASAVGAGVRRRQSPAGRSSAGDGVRREREQRERAAAAAGGVRVARVASRESRGRRDAGDRESRWRQGVVRSRLAGAKVGC